MLDRVAEWCSGWVIACGAEEIAQDRRIDQTGRDHIHRHPRGGNSAAIEPSSKRDPGLSENPALVGGCYTVSAARPPSADLLEIGARKSRLSSGLRRSSISGFLWIELSTLSVAGFSTLKLQPPATSLVPSHLPERAGVEPWLLR
jgi:hypothetical protein